MGTLESYEAPLPPRAPRSPADPQHHAALELERARSKCQKPGSAGGLAVMRCVRICAANRMVQPDWLAAEFLRRYMQVDRLIVGSFDEAFGRPGPRGAARLAAARARLEHRALVHAEVFRLAIADDDLATSPPVMRWVDACGCAPSVGTVCPPDVRRRRWSLSVRPPKYRRGFPHIGHRQGAVEFTIWPGHRPPPNTVRPPLC